VREYAIVFVVAAAVTYLLTPVVRRVALAWGAMAEPRDRDVHAIPTPRLGGVAMYAGVVAAFLVARSLPFLRKIFTEHGDEPKAVLIAGGLICLIGVADDRWGLDALMKLAGQALCAGVMVLFGVQLLYVLVPWAHQGLVSLDQNTGVTLTVLLLLVLVNSINFIDGLDGLAAGVVGIASIASFSYGYYISVHLGESRASPATLISAVLAGVCAGFLPHNFNPARIFMGDSGSMLIGLMLSAALTSATGTIEFGTLQATEKTAFFVPFLIPVLVLVVPFVDLLLAIARRLRAGRPVFAPDKMHIHHRLLELGHSQRRAVLTIYFWSALIAFGGVALSFTRAGLVLPTVATLAAIALLISALPRLRALRSR
jgi:UDP-GlcNAc:undecaprenyl-phosphate GlcNAc-1-phosphate transferase